MDKFFLEVEGPKSLTPLDLYFILLPLKSRLLVV